MSGNEDQNTETAVNRPPKRKLLRKRQNRDDIFSYRGQIPLSFRAKQVKVDSDSSDSDNDEAFQRVQSEDCGRSGSPKAKESDSDREEDDIWVANDKSLEEINSSASDITITTAMPELSVATLVRINQRQAKNKKLRELDNVLDLLKKSADNSLSSPDSSLRPNSVINLDDSYGLPSPSERNVVVKVRTRSGIKRFTMKAADSFGKIISQLAGQEGVTEDKIMLSLSDINILGYDTPISIQLSVADIIDEVDEDEENNIEIKVQGNDSDSKKTFKISKTDPLEKLMTAYCEFRKLPRSRLKFSFDGEELKGGETPVQLDMEDEDVIDVRVK
ncbi:Ubiquitin-2 like Rad60 SUMO-like [Desmophyllum pertusum]|uniref:Ubiquitin-2 like Rad60 SUMO-like n=1 Tax=Desmophyllum pertusum TaxID=174260 RepID=A0A9W9ZTV9_9CNID|nr:Ubiquitin-2 like Rad60 SUMO-like [Desmophyllum pertusum]